MGRHTAGGVDYQRRCKELAEAGSLEASGAHGSEIEGVNFLGVLLPKDSRPLLEATKAEQGFESPGHSAVMVACHESHLSLARRGR